MESKKRAYKLLGILCRKLFPKYKGESKIEEIENFANAKIKELEKDIESVIYL